MSRSPSRSPNAEDAKESVSLTGPLKDEPYEEYVVAQQEEEVDEAELKEEGEPLLARTKRSPPARNGPQLIGDLPVARAAALATFEELSANHYQYGTLGRSREALEGMICDCQYQHGACPTIPLPRSRSSVRCEQRRLLVARCG